ncbi:MAG TPA: hypothetical protein VGO67_02525 [Verrucomicrobiae bacterium]|jgi:hypothetical protein
MMIRIAVILLALAFSAKAEILVQPHAYPSGFSVVLKLASELCEALPDCYSGQLNSKAVAFQTQQFPVVAPVTTTEETRATRQVCFSAGFIDMVNHICHAKAIDRIEPGYFDSYVKNLAQLCASDPLAAAPNIVSPRYWKDDVMNDQLSYFNQVIGFVTALNLSHHYLGHYAKYASNIAGPGQLAAPINKFLTATEWEGSVRAGAVDALNCALATDGPRALFDAIDRMPQRPLWAAYIVPQQVDIKSLNKQLADYETLFFRGGLR